jgi:hypothetical membrane protein
VAAPVLLIGGWTLAASRQPAGYNPVHDTISALAARGAADRWVMSLALMGVGACYAITANGLLGAHLAGRVVLAIGGLATIGVAAFPQPAHGNSSAHTVAATLAFSALAFWPLGIMSIRSGVSLHRPAACAVATVAMAGLVLWFVAEAHAGHRGLAERAAAGVEALWPCAVVISGCLAVRVRLAAPSVAGPSGSER